LKRFISGFSEAANMAKISNIAGKYISRPNKQ
jgi:hypothetical protein